MSPEGYRYYVYPYGVNKYISIKASPSSAPSTTHTFNYKLKGYQYFSILIWNHPYKIITEKDINKIW